VKRTALGRFKHEGATVTLAKDGRLVVYSGDDERNEYIYKFVSAGRFNPSDRAANMNLLDSGTLYVAAFYPNGKGEWVALKHGENGLTEQNGFPDQGSICVRTRQAADRVGATMMDRPEWIAVHPQTKEVYCTLTNNSQRGSAVSTDDANPRRDNLFGHIIRWNEEGGDSAAVKFTWDIFAMAGNPAAPKPEHKGNVMPMVRPTVWSLTSSVPCGFKPIFQPLF
jgi:secreted PhoX family phosphatase